MVPLVARSQAGQLEPTGPTMEGLALEPARQHDAPTVKRLMIFIGMTVGGWVGWSLGERFGIMTALLLSTLGSIGGVLLGWRIGRTYLS